MRARRPSRRAAAFPQPSRTSLPRAGARLVACTSSSATLGEQAVAQAARHSLLLHCARSERQLANHWLQVEDSGQAGRQGGRYWARPAGAPVHGPLGWCAAPQPGHGGAHASAPPSPSSSLQQARGPPQGLEQISSTPYCRPLCSCAGGGDCSCGRAPEHSWPRHVTHSALLRKRALPLPPGTRAVQPASRAGAGGLPALTTRRQASPRPAPPPQQHSPPVMRASAASGMPEQRGSQAASAPASASLTSSLSSSL